MKRPRPTVPSRLALAFALAAALPSAASGKLGAPEAECLEVEDKLGQLFYIFAFRPHARTGRPPKDDAEMLIAPEYPDVVGDLDIGGVLPWFPEYAHAPIRQSIRRLKESARTPLLVGMDRILSARGAAPLGDPDSFQVGLGAGGGFVGDFARHHKDLPQACLADIARLDAFLHRAAGFNHALGPILDREISYESVPGLDAARIEELSRLVIDRFDEAGVATTLKHFPYVPKLLASGRDLHRATDDTKLSYAESLRAAASYKALGARSDFVMTSHLYNSEVDASDLATFSPIWVDMLRRDMGFQGLLMTDGLYMVEKYPAAIRTMSSRWDPAEKGGAGGDVAVFAARAILAGHDIVFLESHAADTRAVFKGVLHLACQSSEPSARLRDRIRASHARIMAYKSKRRRELLDDPRVPDELLDRAASLYRQVRVGRRCGQPELMRPFLIPVAGAGRNIR